MRKDTKLAIQELTVPASTTAGQVEEVSTSTTPMLMLRGGALRAATKTELKAGAQFQRIKAELRTNFEQGG